MFIEVKDAVKLYGEGENAIHALDHVDLGVEEGEICVILGPSGSGKSTLLNMLGGLDRLDGGEIKVGDKCLSKLGKKELTEYRRSDIGVVFQAYNLIAELTVKENIRVVKDISGDGALDVDILIDELGLKKHSSAFPAELSGGQQQRCAIGRALVKNPKLILCDEPTGALDSVSSREVLKMLEKMNEKYRTTIVIITHNEGIAAMSDRIVRIRDGKITENVKNSRRKAEELEL